MPLIFERVIERGWAIFFNKTTAWKIVPKSAASLVPELVDVQQWDNEQLNIHFKNYLLSTRFTGRMVFML